MGAWKVCTENQLNLAYLSSVQVVHSIGLLCVFVFRLSMLSAVRAARHPLRNFKTICNSAVDKGERQTLKYCTFTSLQQCYCQAE